MSSQTKKRDIADFFKPFGRNLSSTIPRKRPARFAQEDEDGDTIIVNERAIAPKTPAKSVSFKDVTPSPHSIRQPTFSPVSEAALPIRSPRPNRIQTPAASKQRIETRSSSSQKKSPSTVSKSDTSFTFSDVSERSQNVVKAGVLVAVRDSDEDSDDSLESLSAIFRHDKKSSNANGPASSQSSEGNEAERIRTLSKFTHGRAVPIVGKDKLRALYAKEKASKFDLRRILNDHCEDEDREKAIKEARKGHLEENDEQEAKQVDKSLLESIVRNADGEADSDDVTRLLSAVERTEALDGEKTYSFFGTRQRDEGIDEDMDEDFPEVAIPHEFWQPGDQEGCARAYLSGILAEEARCCGLAHDAMRWTFEQVTKEPRDDLRQSYIQALEANKVHWTRLSLTAWHVQTAFQNLGASPDALRDNSTITPRYHSKHHGPKRDLKYLISILDLFTAICSDMDMAGLSKLSSIVLRLTLDTTTISNPRLSFAVENLTSTLLDLPDKESATHVYNRLLTDASNHLHDPKLQALLLSHIPPSSPLASQLRKTLADVFLFGPSTIDPILNTSNASFNSLSKLISTSPLFNLTRHHDSSPFDYTSLTALTFILDVSIGSGNPPPIPLPPATSHPSSPSNSKSSKSTINKFNTSLDTLANSIHTLFISIKDTGASHMRRTEAKDALQALYFRLLYSVRVGVRKKSHVFDIKGKDGGRVVGRDGDVVREENRGGEFMKRFLRRDRTGEVVVEGPTEEGGEELV